jgi:hypothetical protein
MAIQIFDVEEKWAILFRVKHIELGELAGSGCLWAR